MSSEAVYVAIGIACVVAVLLFIVFIIYCVKRHNDKLYSRQARERRRREERHRRNLMMGHMVRPPPYDPNGPNLAHSYHREIPFTPPPEYKEVATPLPRNGVTVGLGDMPYRPPLYDYPDDVIPTVSGRVSNNNNYYHNNNNNNRTANMNRINTLHVRPTTTPSIVVPPHVTRDPLSYHDSVHREGPPVDVSSSTNRGVPQDVGRPGRDSEALRAPPAAPRYGAAVAAAPRLSVEQSAILAHSYNSQGPPSSRIHRDTYNNYNNNNINSSINETAEFSTSRSIYASGAPPPNTVSGNFRR